MLAISPVLLLVSSVAAGPTVGSCPVFPEDHIWNARIDQLPVHPKSRQYIGSIGAESPLHPDFGSGSWKGKLPGIPYIVAARHQKKEKVVLKSPESDTHPYAIPANAPIEGGGDRHVLSIDPTDCHLYELFLAERGGDGKWAASSGAIFNLKGYELRTSGWTSADAAGLPVFPGLARYDEVASGVIRHALRFTARRTQRKFVWPARHFASRLSDEDLPPMGMRVRLRADYPIEGFPPQARVILQALKTYGMMLADNGGPWYVSGAPDPGWKNDQLRTLKKVRGADFEVVDATVLMENPNSGRVKKGSRN